MSSSATVRPWPIWRLPLAFGGGMTIVNGAGWLFSVLLFFGEKAPEASQRA